MKESEGRKKMKVMMDGEEVDSTEWDVVEKWSKEWCGRSREFALLRRPSPIWAFRDNGVPIPEYRFAEIRFGAWEARSVVPVFLAERIIDLALVAEETES